MDDYADDRTIPDILLLFYSCFETELIYFEIQCIAGYSFPWRRSLQVSYKKKRKAKRNKLKLNKQQKPKKNAVI